MLEQAIQKIDKEVKEFNGGKYENAVYRHVADTLKNFCRQEPEFAQAVVQTDKTLADCCREIMKGAGQSISDIEVYRRAVNFYFPGADIKTEMRINLCASVETPQANNIIHLSLDDLMDF